MNKSWHIYTQELSCSHSTYCKILQTVRGHFYVQMTGRSMCLLLSHWKTLQNCIKRIKKAKAHRSKEQERSPERIRDVDTILEAGKQPDEH